MPFFRQNLKADICTLAASNPVTLHRLDPCRPIHVFQIGEQTVGVSGDLEIPLLQCSCGDRRVTAPAAARFYLLVRQDRLAGGAPPLLSRRPVSQAATVQQQEEPLSPAIEVRIGGAELPGPVVGAFDQFHLAAISCCVASGSLGRVGAVLNGVILCRQTKSIPSHRVQNIEALHPQITGADAGGNVIAAVAYRQPGAGRVREEIEDIVAGLIRILARLV